MAGKNKKKKADGNTITVNKKASFKYQLSDQIEAGLQLMGSEVKSLRQKMANLTDSYVVIRRGEAWLISCHISPYSYAHQFNHEPRRERKLLLHKKEIEKLTVKMHEKGLTLIPTKLYFKNGRAKVLLAIAKGKKLFDKREAIKSRDNKRDIDRAIKNR